MSVLFPKVNKPREWDYRPIYYDPEKEARKEKLARLHRGSFREQHEKNMQTQKSKNNSRLIFWIALLVLALALYLFLR
ncbi:MAG: hypothetical protein IKT19_03735 [Paludibacteraceae bacterium]|nr:hypothetical protein [Paludibacteraceae bacterium]